MCHSAFECVVVYLVQYSHSHPCTATPMTTSMSEVSSNNRCPKCGTVTKSGATSCCARGGAWFKNCGDVGDTRFGHTWTEGIRVCEHVAPSVTLESPLQVMFGDVAVMPYLLNETQRRNATSTHQTRIDLSVSMFNVGTTDLGDCVGLTRAASMVCVWVVVLFQTSCGHKFVSLTDGPVKSNY